MIIIEIFAYLVLIALSFQLFNVILNAITPIFLKEVNIKFNTPLISVLIPARNEENNISNILNDLINQEYENIEIIVFDDNSEDNTANIVKEFIKQDNRISLINSNVLPQGWIGKSYACNELSKKAKGEYFLFVDSDVRLRGTILTRAIHFSLMKTIDLLTIFPMQTMLSFGEKITIPNMNFILLSLLPLIFVRKSIFKSHSAANGQFMLFNSDIYKKLKPHEFAKNNRVEDIAIARYFKKNNKTVSTHLGDLDLRCRMYENYNQAIAGFSKNIAEFFGNSYIFAFLFWAINTFGFLFVYFAFGFDLMVIYLLSIAINRVIVAHLSKQCVVENLKLTIFQQYSFLIMLINSLKNKLNKSYEWKGRNI